MVVAQKLKESEITEQILFCWLFIFVVYKVLGCSFFLCIKCDLNCHKQTRNLLRIGVFNISYIRGLFPEHYFNDKSVPALGKLKLLVGSTSNSENFFAEMKIKKLMPIDAESRRLIDWMEKGVYDALQKKYLRTLLFCISEAIEGPMIEDYAFSFSYSISDSEEVMMNISRTGNNKQGATFKSNDNTYITPNQMSTILMKLLYYEDVTPIDFEPPFFRGCSEQETKHPWLKNPLKMEIGNVNNKHFVLALKVKSILDPCQNEDNDMEDDADIRLGDSTPITDPSDSDSEMSHSTNDDGYIVAPVDRTWSRENNGRDDSEDDTHDAEEDKHQFTRVRDWIGSRLIDNVELTDVLSNFPDISVALTEADDIFQFQNINSFYFHRIMDKLVNQNIMSRTGKDSYSIRKLKKHNLAIVMKEEMDVQVNQVNEKVQRGNDEDYLYMKSLYHVLPLDYVKISKLQTKLEGEANQAILRKLLDKMACDGYVEVKSRPVLGKRVIRSELTDKKLAEVKNALQIKLSPAVSRESGIPWNDKRNGVYGRGLINCGEGNDTLCRRPSQKKRSRKTSTVKEHILQNMKRQKSQGGVFE
ncbi:hypothetical protein MKX03_035046 [Papaver bracteatum]|nr:hypothetical protein MKX03_035046 [Papaver bracteatum]